MKEKTIACCFLFAALMIAAACGGGHPPGKEKNAEGGSPPGDGSLLVKQPHFQLREEPGEGGKSIRGLKPGEKAVSLGEQSAFTTRLELGGIAYDEPWLLVQMEDGLQGWAYEAAFLDPKAGVGLPLPTRLRALFGPALAETAMQYRESFASAHSAEAVAQAMAMGVALRDSLVRELALRAGGSRQTEDLFWLKDALPGFVPHLQEDGRAYYLFMDFRAFLPLAGASEGPADDAFLELCLAAYPEDSIEYFYPAWKFQSDEKKVHSLLGRGLHFAFLEKLDKLLPYTDLYGEGIGRFRQQLINDITGKDVTYWESREKAAAELGRIVEAGFQVFGPEDMKALEARYRQFGDPAKFGIKFNYRSGIYELD